LLAITILIGAAPSVLAHTNSVSAEHVVTLAEHYAEDGQTGLAVLHYERALFLAPGETAAANSLTELRRKTGLLREKPLHQRLAALLGADQWLLLAGASFVLLALTVLTAGLLGRRRFPQACRLSTLLLAATLLPLPLAWLRYQQWQDGVLLKESKLLLSPFAEADTVAALKAGCLVRPAGTAHGAYVLVRDEDGHSGWLEQRSVQQIVPSP
jgi:hypothetical protein